jgi:hypothetical protein
VENESDMLHLSGLSPRRSQQQPAGSQRANAGTIDEGAAFVFVTHTSIAHNIDADPIELPVVGGSSTWADTEDDQGDELVVSMIMPPNKEVLEDWRFRPQ